ncbi:hypothetical protein NUW58_g943 [Xylaria curta]|uniref:Uncharacterized protein n=1 Tax=Xylaria curta TaxID=42375 RepID=A0ACC1PPD5_9PEZI|nr:hypothetical protein NUW58_g943 [Xylaria curta]
MSLLDVNINEAKEFFGINFWGVLADTQAFAHMLIKAKGIILNHNKGFGNFIMFRIILRPLTSILSRPHDLLPATNCRGAKNETSHLSAALHIGQLKSGARFVPSSHLHVPSYGGTAGKRGRTRRSRFEFSEPSQEKLSDDVASEGVGKELLPSCGKQSLVSEDLAKETTPLLSVKQQPDTVSEIHSLPAKRARSTRTNIQLPGVEDENAEQVAKTGPQHPKPEPPKRLCASLLEPKVEEPEQVSPATWSRKRQIGCGVDKNRHQLKRARLTRKNVALFNRMARKNEANKASASASLESAVGLSTTKTTSTTSTGFDVRARKNGMLDPRSSKPPTNLKDLEKRHTQSRGSASPTESAYKGYVDTVERAGNEATMVVEASERLLKRYPNGGYTRSFKRAFTAFPKDVGFNNGLTTPQPDFVEGLEMQDYLPFPVDEHVNGAVLYMDDRYSVTLPHIAGEWKGPDGRITEATLQSGYDGAALVYARNQALSLIGKPDPPGHAEVTTFTTDGANINFYAHYAALSGDDTLEYHQYRYASVNLIDNHLEHKRGYRGVRNEQDHARKESCALRDQLMDYWRQHRDALQPITERAPLPVADATFEETNAGEDEAIIRWLSSLASPHSPRLLSHT